MESMIYLLFLSPFLYCSSTQITDHQLPISRTRIAFQNASFLMYLMAKVAKKRLSFFLPISLQRQPDIMRQPECRKGDLSSFFTPPTCQNSFSSSKILSSTPRMNIRDKSMKVFKMNPWTNIEFRFLLALDLTIKKIPNENGVIYLFQACLRKWKIIEFYLLACLPHRQQYKEVPSKR